jgi:hypothetical protein
VAWSLNPGLHWAETELVLVCALLWASMALGWVVTGGPERWILGVVAATALVGAGPLVEEPAVEFRRLQRTELSRVGEIDHTERINVLYDQHGTQHYADNGGIALSVVAPR